MSRIALVRAVSDSIAACELTHLERTPVDLARARAQHAAYRAALAALGCQVHELPPLHEHPDAVFVEDTAVVLDGLAVIARPGAASRRGEVGSMATALARHRPLAWIEAPGTLDGGDVLVVGDTLFVGLTARTDAAGVAQLGALAAPLGYRTVGVPVRGCLHLKTAVGLVAPDTLLINPAWVAREAFGARRLIEVDPAEPMAANALAIDGAVIHPEAFVRTAARLAAAGLTLVRVPADELGKAEGGVTCCSVVFAG